MFFNNNQVFYLISAAKFVHHLAKTKKLHSFSSAPLFLFNVSILCFCTTLSSRTVRTNSLPDLILIIIIIIGPKSFGIRRPRSLTAAGVPVTKEPCGLARTDSRRPDGLTRTLWQAGKPLTWDVTVVSIL